MATKVEIPDTITVGELADKLSIPVTKLIGELMKAGVMATVNERVDYDTAEIILADMDLDIELSRASAKKEAGPRQKPQASDNAGARPPVVAVMGHVDHGKTSLLDAIRGGSVADGEAGGITQHISAYQIEHADRKITFLDTPGHEAFAALREHGAQLTDVVIIVVAADDGVKPQTIEAIRFARKAGVKIIVAINKIDKPDGDQNIVKQQLSEQNILVEEWGGETVVVPVSAKTKEGIPKLLDMILLIADVEELKADTDVPAQGLIIEAHKEQGRGPVARALVEAGTLKPGSFVVAGGTYARVRNLDLSGGGPLKQAGPSTPVVMSGFKELPEFGQEFITVKTEKEARKIAEENLQNDSKKGVQGEVSSSDLIRIIDRTNSLTNLNVIVKADVQGSLTSVIDGLKSLDTEEVAVRVVGSGVGSINENDIHMAQSSDAIIYGFHVDMPTNIKRSAARDKVPVRLYDVIYEIFDDAKIELTKLLAPEVKETEMGRLVVRGIFKTTKTSIICGGEVTKGKMVTPALAKVYRDKEMLAEVEVTSLKRGPQDVKEVLEGEMCGISIATSSKVDLEEGDRIEVYTRETVTRSL